MPYIAVISIFMLFFASRSLHLFTFGAGAAEARDFALSAVLFAGLVLAALVGTALIRIDLERGTLALLLSQPVRLDAYILGRFLGLAAATLLLCALTAGGVAAALALTDAPDGTLSPSLLLGWLRVALAVVVLAAAALAVSAATSRIFGPVLLLALFLAGDIAPDAPFSRVLPTLGLFGLDAARDPPLPWLTLYAGLYSVVFLSATYLQLALRPPTRTES
jgi:ABC-type transport system involved in multi-copper enzyme maturation permease subunit